jgi:hypothetical protein
MEQKTLEDVMKDVTISISASAAAKAQDIAKKVSYFAQKSLEIFSVPLGQVLHLNNHIHIVIDDIYVPTRQKITPASFAYNSLPIMRNAKRNGIYNRMIGWIHSHGGIDVFHSSIDHPNLLGWLDFANYSFRRQQKFGEKRVVEKYCFVPSIVFNQYGAKPDIRLYAKRTTESYISDALKERNEEKHWRNHDIMGIENHMTVQLAPHVHEEINQSIESVLQYNDMKQEIKPKSITITDFYRRILSNQNYSSKIRKLNLFIDSYFVKNTTSHTNWKIAVKILSGKHFTVSNEPHARCWKWTKRFDMIQEHLNANPDMYDKNLYTLCSTILQSHHYITKRHPTILNKFTNMFSKEPKKCIKQNYMTDSQGYSLAAT